jgi:magnesium chelatase subunit D
MRSKSGAAKKYDDAAIGLPACPDCTFQLQGWHLPMKNSPKPSPPQPSAYPFSAIVGQDEMKLALILNVIDPAIGGVVMMGHRGTGKSTIVRALANLLPPMSVVSECSYRCDPASNSNLCDDCRSAISSGATLSREKRAVPVAELPLGATEDRVCGSIDIEQALGSGLKRFEPGLLARANRGFLYIDEVNLLEDHLVDLLLDVAATGVNKVERESISVSHPARFVLIGSGNPEEGELRPQLLDRFGLFVDVKTEDELARRVEIVERRDAFEREPLDFRLAFANEEEALRKKIVKAQKDFLNVTVGRPLLELIAGLCSDLKIDGHRGELTIMRAARALTAFQRRKQVSENDVRQVAVMALRHRLRRTAFAEAASAERIEQALDQILDQTFRDKTFHPADSGDDGDGLLEAGSESSRDVQTRTGATSPTGDRGGARKRTESAPPVGRDRLPIVDSSQSKPKDRKPKPQFQSGQSRLSKTVYDRERGKYSRSVCTPKRGSRIALDATLRALLNSGVLKSSATGRRRVPVPDDALRFKLFKRKQGRLFIFAIDLSGSMALNRIARAKATMLALLRQSYVKRDSVAIVGFGGESAELLLPPSRSILRATRVLDSLRIGGGTPLSAGLACALKLAKRGDTQGELVLLVFTDGRANVALRESDGLNRSERQELIAAEVRLIGDQLHTARVRTILIDTQNQFTRNDAARALAQDLGADYQLLSLAAAGSDLLFTGGLHDLG